MGVDVQCGRCLGMAQAIGHCAWVLMAFRNQQRGRRMPKSMERDARQLIFGIVVGIILCNDRLQGMIRCLIVHHTTVLLNKQKVLTFPIITDLPSVFLLTFP